MSMREIPGAPPAESQLAEGQVPRPSESPSAPGFTPGVALAGARAPIGPTLPDWDPSTLNGLLGQLANELFSPTVPAAHSQSVVPPAPSAQSIQAPSAQSVQAPGAQSVQAPPIVSYPAAPAAVPVESAAPFHAPLSFQALSDFGAPSFDRIALFEPQIASAPNPGAISGDPLQPYWAAPQENSAQTRTPEISAHSFQLEPTTDVSLRPFAGTPFDAHAIRREFPILKERINGRELVWLDNAATTQKPQAVIDRLSYFYEHENSNIHRAAHALAARSSDAYESARETVRRFIQAPSKNEIVFVRGTTEGINLVAQSWGRRNVAEGDEIVITWLEHHANIVPWQQLCSEKGARLRVAPVDDRGQVILEEYEKLLGPKTKLVSFPQVSNALGTITPAREMIELAHRHGAKVLLDGAQGISHMAVDVQALDCDFYIFSGHKVFAPTGIGVVFGKSHLLEAMPPWQGGGNMIQDVTFEKTVYQGPPARFEAGTGNIADAIGLGAALDWLARVGVENVGRYEHELLVYATERLSRVPGLTMIGTAPDKAGVLSFVLAGQKTEEMSGILDKEGIAVRSGHHCAQPILRRFGLEATVRASLAPYNTCEDIDALVSALLRLQTGHGAPR